MTTGSVLAQFTITLSQAVSEQVAVEWHTADGTAIAGVDYAAAKGTVLFSPGQTAKTVEILVHGRAVGSEDRSFFVEMLPPTNAILGASIGECIIHVDATGSTPVTQIIVPTGPRGLQGDSAYQTWLDLGNTGTEEDFINSLKPSAEEIAEEVAPLIDLSNSPLTAEGTETLSKPDTITGKRLARRVAYVGAAKVATVVLADGDNLITHAALSGDAVDFNSVSLYPRILRGAVVISPEWSVEPGDKILIKSAVAGDVLHVCQYDVISERAVKNVVEPLVSAALAPVGSQAFEALRRSYAEAGYNLVDGSFEASGTLVNANDVLLQKRTGKAFSGPAGPVAAGTNPASGGFVDVSHLLLSSSLPAYVDYYKYPTTTDTEAVDAAMAASKHVVFGPRKYTYTKELISVGHTLDGAVSETFGTTGTVIEFDMPSTPASGFAFRNVSRKGSVRNVRFIQKSWGISLNGLKADRLIDTHNAEFSYFNGHGAVLTSTDSLSESCYSSTLKNLACAYNAKHGIVLGGAANAVVIDNPRCNWNGSPAYGVAPTVAGLYDGLYSGGKNSEYPGNPSIFNDPQGVVLIGGDYSYNSRTGLNLDRFFDGVVVGGYSEFNLVSDMKIRSMFGSTVANFMAQDLPDIVVPDADPLKPSFLLQSYPNRIVVRGRSYGTGKVSSTPNVYETPMDSLRSSGTLGSLRITPTTEGGVKATKSGGNGVKLHMGDVPFIARNACLGDGFLDTDTATRASPFIRRAGNVEGDESFVIEAAGQFLKFFIANGSGASTSATGLLIPKNSTTNRSINAGGTVNTTGADYAEYMRKSDGCGDIQKGAICGVNSAGMLTDRFDDSISFVIKSTDPSFVGGDTWFTEKEPEVPLSDDGEDDHLSPAYLESLSAYRQRLESARKRVDRIAFSGQVPVNVIGANPGDYIVPVRNEDGTIGGNPVCKPTQDEYQVSVGKVWRVLDDGRAFVAVKIA